MTVAKFGNTAQLDKWRHLWEYVVFVNTFDCFHSKGLFHIDLSFVYLAVHTVTEAIYSALPLIRHKREKRLSDYRVCPDYRVISVFWSESSLTYEE